MAVLAIVLFFIAKSKGSDIHIVGLKNALMLTLQVLPLLIFAFIIAGLMQTLIPKQAVSHWIGADSGLRGIVIGALAGGITPGGPYVSLPIAAGLLNSGANMGTIIAFITSWSVWSFSRLPMEIAIIGWKVTLIRLLSVIFMPFLAGIIANYIAQLFE